MTPDGRRFEELAAVADRASSLIREEVSAILAQTQADAERRSREAAVAMSSGEARTAAHRVLELIRTAERQVGELRGDAAREGRALRELLGTEGAQAVHVPEPAPEPAPESEPALGPEGGASAAEVPAEEIAGTGVGLVRWEARADEARRRVELKTDEELAESYEIALEARARAEKRGSAEEAGSWDRLVQAAVTEAVDRPAFGEPDDAERSTRRERRQLAKRLKALSKAREAAVQASEQ